MINTSKKIAKLITGLLFISFITTTHAANFSDVNKSAKYATAITYLADRGIINGYPDGTFQPNKNVSRAEFLKILLESSGINSDVETPTGFKDVDEAAWYAKYIRKAKKEGWIQGYEDNTFKPERGVNKVEALKIAAKVQSWALKTKVFSAPFNDTPTLAWYAPYIEYAKSKNFLEDTGRFFIPDAILTRGQVSELLFRGSVVAATDATSYSPALLKNLPAIKLPANTETQNQNKIPIKRKTSNLNDAQTQQQTQEPTSQQTQQTVQAPTNTEPVEPTQNTNFTPVATQTIPANFFNNVTLNSTVPNTFYLNEIYNFEGTISSGTYTQAFVFLAPTDSTDPSTYTNFTTTVSGKSFNIPVSFKQTGNYKLGLILGSSGESKIINISVLKDLPQSYTIQKPAMPGTPDINYQNAATTVSFTTPLNTISKITIFQTGVSKQIISRQQINKITLDYADFAKFSEGKTYIQLEQAKLQKADPLQISTDWTGSQIKSFTATTHQYNLVDTDSITVSAVPGTLSQIQPITFSGTVKTNTYQKAAIIKPDGSVDNQNLTSSSQLGTHLGSPIIPNGGNFTFNYTPKTTGTYIIEINNQDGEATLNIGIYVANGIPLLPDYFDFNHDNDKELNFSLNVGRTQLLNLINQARKNAGLNAVVLDNDLNTLAQNHSDDMKNRNFFGHINPDNKTPEDRRKALNIPTPVGENLAKSQTIIYAHNGLMQSAIHRQNILDPKWTKVGLGLTQSGDYILTTEEFSANPLTDSDLQTLKNNIVNQINSKRTGQSLNPISSDATLENIAFDWSEKMVTENFFDFVSPNGASLSNNIRAQIPIKSVQALILSSNNQDKLIEQITNGADAVSNKWSFTGIGLKTDSLGTIKVTLLYTTS